MKQLVLLTLSLFIFGSNAQADRLTPAKASKNIAAAVKAFEPLAGSGVEKFKIKPVKTIKEAMLALAFKAEYISEESEFNWIESGGDAWGADSMAFGQTTMKGAYNYIIKVDKEYVDGMDEKERTKYLANVEKAKEAFKLLLNTGVQFGLAPMGAIQCGVTFAALAIIDPNTGIIYVFAKEGSGC